MFTCCADRFLCLHNSSLKLDYGHFFNKMLILADLRTQIYCDLRGPTILALKHVPLCNRALTFDIISLIVRLLEPYKGCSNGSGRLHKYVMD